MVAFLTSVIKSVSLNIADFLTHIFNKSFTTGIFPDMIKDAKVVPIYTADDKLSFSNYRSISLLPVISKALERFMHYRIISFFIEKCNLLSEHQYGYREKHSTYRALLDVIDEISESVDNKHFSICVFLDLEKVF